MQIVEAVRLANRRPAPSLATPDLDRSLVGGIAWISGVSWLSQILSWGRHSLSCIILRPPITASSEWRCCTWGSFRWQASAVLVRPS